MYGAHALPKYEKSLANELQQVLNSVGKINIFNDIKLQSTVKYNHRVIIWLNKYKPKVESGGVI